MKKTRWSWSFAKGIGWALPFGAGGLYVIKDEMVRHIAYSNDYSYVYQIIFLMGLALWLGGLRRLNQQQDEQIYW